MRQVAIDAASIPKDAKIAALEKNSAESEKMIAEARSDKIKQLEEMQGTQVCLYSSLFNQNNLKPESVEDYCVKPEKIKTKLFGLFCVFVFLPIQKCTCLQLPGYYKLTPSAGNETHYKKPHIIICVLNSTHF